MAQTAKWEGIFPAVTTKFKEDGSLDGAEMARCYRLNIEAGVDGLIVCGSLGEASTLDPDEKLEVLKVARSTAGQRPVLLTISDGSTRNAQRLAERGAAAGAAGFMVLPGLPYKSDARETMAHCTAVAKAGGLPVMIYNNPVAYGVDITPAMLAEMAAEPLFAAVKESSDDIRRVTDIISQLGSRYQVFAGVDNLALESFAMGAAGWVAGVGLAFPEENVAIWQLHKAGRFEEARAIYRWMRPMLDIDVSTKLVQNIKLAEAIAIGSNDRCRPPRLPLAGEERARITSIVEEGIRRRPKLPPLRMAAE